jgi:hypothetical protein
VIVMSSQGRMRRIVQRLSAPVVRRRIRAIAPAVDGSPLLVGRFNDANASTVLARNDGFGPGLLVTSSPGVGVAASGTGGNPGVFGTSDGAAGVFGSSPSVGVQGSGGDSGVVGVHTGESISELSPGVSGYGRGTGVYGRSAIGVFGASTGEDSVLGTFGVGVYGINAGNGWAALFDGEVAVEGSFIATYKSAAVPFPDGSRRRLYCMESPESWFEDFGEAQLSGGRADVVLAADFAAVIDASSYHVFAIPHDATCRGLAVVARHADRFEVRELAGGTSASGFSYRVVARRKDIALPRMQPVPPRAAAVRLPEPPPVPTSPMRGSDGVTRS